MILLLFLSMFLQCFGYESEQAIGLPLELTVKSAVAGDVDLDGRITIADVVALIDYILAGSSDAPITADVDLDGKVSIADVVFLIDIILYGPQETHDISSAYYYIGTSNGWTPHDATYKLTNGGGDVQANPVFTVVIPATGGYNWFKIYPQETMDVAEADFWNADFIGYSQDGANGMSGTFVEGPNDQVAFSFKIPPSATAVGYRLSFDMKNRTFNFQGIESSDTARANELFKKCYDYVNGHSLIAGMDGGFTNYTRQLWNSNELTTDEAICGWGDTGTPEYCFNHYDASHPMLKGFYLALYACIDVCNEYLEDFNDYDATKSAEVRFLRALHYFYLLDGWGNVPLVTTTGAVNPPQSSRVELFQWLEQELLSLRDGLCEPVTRHEGEVDYGRVDRDAANLLLSRLYLNAQVYTGVARWADAARYAKMVIDGPHKLHTQSYAGTGIDGVYREYTPYQMLFMGDNGNTAAAGEAVFPLPHDGARADNMRYGWGGTTFLICSTVDTDVHPNPYDPQDINGLYNNNAWGGSRARPQLVRLFFPNDDAPKAHVYDVYPAAQDDRALFETVGRYLNVDVVSDFRHGYAAVKFNNFKTDGSRGSSPTFPDADFFMMRSAEAYLTYAEALTCKAGGVAPAEAVEALNAIRARAHAEQRTSYTLYQILDEWGREFYFEGRRRMDLIRFNRYSGTTDYLWSWKGGILEGRNFDAFRNMFAIPADVMAANPNLVQNPGYEYEAAHPITFNLSTPVNTLVDIDGFLYIPFEWSEPDYWWPSSLYYRLEVSPTNEWNVSTDEAAADKTGELEADYAVLTPTNLRSLSSEVSVEELNWALTQICHWSEDNMPDCQPVYVRCVAKGYNYSNQCYSNVVSLEVKPHYVATLDPPVNLWYMVGNCIGDGSWWNNEASSVGVSLIPTYSAYDTDGTSMDGSMYIGYFPEGGQFKFIHVPGDWSEQLNFYNVKNPGTFLSDEDGDNHNIGITEAGYYRIWINAKDEITIEQYTEVPSIYESISMPSDYNDWNPGNDFMAVVSTSPVLENHDWFSRVTFDMDTYVKFAANGVWDYNWGNSDFPYGIGVQNGPSIPVKAGNYAVLFNDIMGTYDFVDLDAGPEPYVPYEPYVPSISSAYYYIGTSNDWTPYDSTYKLDNGGGDVYANPVFTVTIPATGEDNTFKIYPQETMEADEGDFWNSDFIGYYSEASNGMSGTFVKGPNDQAAFSFVIPASIPADKYKLTFDMQNRTFEFQAIEGPDISEPVVPDLWYLIGPGFGDGSWNNRGMDDVGVSMTPMYGVPGSATILKWVGYLAARRTFKIIHTPGESEQLSMVDGVIALNNGDGGNIRVTEAGYYEITVNTDSYEVTIEKLDITPGVYSMMGMPGSYQGWNPAENLMIAVNTRAENHDWIVKDLTFAEYAELKFAADGNWTANWGGNTFPVGLADQYGPNIPVAQGTYTVMFNDILGYYYFMTQE